MSNPRVWSLISIPSADLQYAGNSGYDDESSRLYSYDSNVANHKQLSVGDLVFIRNRKNLIGLARIEEISSRKKQKLLQRCPVCNSTGIKRRKTFSPPFRCNKGHEFKIPSEESKTVTAFEAHYGNTFMPITNGTSSKLLKRAALRPSDQLAIEELDFLKVGNFFSGKYPDFNSLAKGFIQAQSIESDDSDENVDNPEKSDVSPFFPSLLDTRKAVLRSIKLRRGQKKFRNRLKLEYGAICMVSGCSLWEIIEAAHIDPYRDVNDNHPRNGLLLRADLHTLFDLNLMAVEPKTLSVHFSPSVIKSGYRELEGKKLKTTKTCWPAPAPLESRWAIFIKLFKSED